MILLSFDIEEFDLPLEYGNNLPLKDQIEISTKGVYIILELLKKFDAKATFYCTAVYALNKPEVVKEIANQGHEIASHGYYHSSFKEEDLLLSKNVLEEISGQKIYGFRMPRLAKVSDISLEKAGYTYNSSLNPTWIPGRYNHFRSKKTYHKKGDLFILPVSVSPLIRFPLFWLSFHALPLSIMKLLSAWTYANDNYLHLYFHPWEFVDLKKPVNYTLPSYISKKSGADFAIMLDIYLAWGQTKKYQFNTTHKFLKEISPIEVCPPLI